MPQMMRNLNGCMKSVSELVGLFWTRLILTMFRLYRNRQTDFSLF